MQRICGYFTRELGIIFLLGFYSGLPLALTGSTFSAWLSDSRLDIASIGLFALVATPYSLKFLWSPFMDTLPPPPPFKKSGRRRGWIMTTQALLLLVLLAFACINPSQHLYIAALLALMTAFFSASQDIVIDAYRVEAVASENQPGAIFMVQLGYRMGMIVSTAGALTLATYTSWQVTYAVMGGMFLCAIAVTFSAKEPETIFPPGNGFTSLREIIIEPFTQFARHNSWWLILLFVIIYKLADAFMGTLTTPFLLQLGFAKTDIARILKLYGVIATFAGIFAGSKLVERYGTVKIMFAAGLLHAATNLLYIAQARAGADSLLLTVSVIMENATGGISSAAFVVFLSALCRRQYTATHYALLSSLSALGRTWLSAPAGYVVKWLGWELFFLFSALLAVPGLVLLHFVQKKLK